MESPRRLLWVVAGVLFFLVLMPWSSLLADEAGSYGSLDRMVTLVVQISIIIFAARFGGAFFEKLHLPPVLGEIMAGVIIGPFVLGHIPLPGFEQGLFPIQKGFPLSPELHGITTIASLVLLFLVGLETDIETFLSFSMAGFVVGIGGVVVSFLFGDLVTVYFARAFFNVNYGFGDPIPLFLGVVTTATSVGITARILSEKRKIDSPEGVTILAGAVIDDVLGIILLAVVIGIINGMKGGGHVAWKTLTAISVKAVAIWLGFTVAGLVFSRQLSEVLKRFRDKANIAVISLAMAMLLAGIFEKSGLAMIIGAYIMGLSLSKTDLSFVIQENISILYRFFVPIFFCSTGMMVNFLELASWKVVLFGMVFVLFSILAKILGCSIPALFLNFNWRGALRIGVGMTPRGEVTLIITGIGLSMGILTHEYFGIVIIMTFLTTLIAPLVLARMLESEKPVLRKEKQIKKEQRQVAYNMPNPETADLILGKIVGAFESEGFYIHLIHTRQKIYQIRKSQTFITLKFTSEKIIFDCQAKDVAFIHTLFYEVLAELERTMKQLQTLTDRDKIGKKIFTKSEGEDSEGRSAIAQVLHPLAVEVELKGQDKESIIHELIGLLITSGQLDASKKSTARKDIFEREALMSTGMQDGIAYPHAKTSSVSRLVCAVGLKKNGIDFDSLDKKPSKIFIMTLSPKESSEPQLQFMAGMSKLLSSRDARGRLFSCKTSDQLFHVLTQA
ncbi:MAG: cation:proton antiporter [Candidatus Aureabacteria bacterium]|nr:cation:proton antiporter [Candidatus Auribacterota bacterium]